MSSRCLRSLTRTERLATMGMTQLITLLMAFTTTTITAETCAPSLCAQTEISMPSMDTSTSTLVIVGLIGSGTSRTDSSLVDPDVKADFAVALLITATKATEKGGEKEEDKVITELSSTRPSCPLNQILPCSYYYSK